MATEEDWNNCQALRIEAYWPKSNEPPKVIYVDTFFQGLLMVIYLVMTKEHTTISLWNCMRAELIRMWGQEELFPRKEI